MGCDRPTGSTRSQAHTSPSSAVAEQRQQTQPGRVGQGGEALGQRGGVASEARLADRAQHSPLVTGIVSRSVASVAVVDRHAAEP